MENSRFISYNPNCKAKTYISGFVLDSEKTPIVLGKAGDTDKLTFKVNYTEKYKDKDGNEKELPTQWVELTAFGAKAVELHKFIEKGMLIRAQVRIEQESWEKEGVKYYKDVYKISGFVEVIWARNLEALIEKGLSDRSAHSTESAMEDERPY